MRLPFATKAPEMWEEEKTSPFAAANAVAMAMVFLIYKSRKSQKSAREDRQLTCRPLSETRMVHNLSHTGFRPPTYHWMTVLYEIAVCYQGSRDVKRKRPRHDGTY